MKLLYCCWCGDVFSLALHEKSCSCGQTKGHYETDKWHAKYSGTLAIPIGFDNGDFLHAVDRQPTEGWGEGFNAFIIPKQCQSFVKE